MQTVVQIELSLPGADLEFVVPLSHHHHQHEKYCPSPHKKKKRVARAG